MTAMTIDRPAPPSALSIARARTVLELKLYVREPQQVVFSFAYPVIMMVIFGSVFGDEIVSPGVTLAEYFVAGIAATGIMLTSFQAVATSIAESATAATWPGCRCWARRRRPTSPARPARW